MYVHLLGMLDLQQLEPEISILSTMRVQIPWKLNISDMDYGHLA